MLSEEEGKQSHLFTISIRGVIALILVLTVCIMEPMGKTVEEPLYSLVLLAVGFYFGQKTHPTTPKVNLTGSTTETATTTETKP